MNPHNHIVALDPPGSAGRHWRCRFCGEVGLCKDLVGPKQKNPCAYTYPPCDVCGQTPVCAPNCAGILGALGASGVHVIGGDKPRLPEA